MTIRMGHWKPSSHRHYCENTVSTHTFSNTVFIVSHGLDRSPSLRSSSGISSDERTSRQQNSSMVVQYQRQIVPAINISDDNDFEESEVTITRLWSLISHLYSHSKFLFLVTFHSASSLSLFLFECALHKHHLPDLLSCALSSILQECDGVLQWACMYSLFLLYFPILRFVFFDIKYAIPGSSPTRKSACNEKQPSFSGTWQILRLLIGLLSYTRSILEFEGWRYRSITERREEEWPAFQCIAEFVQSSVRFSTMQLGEHLAAKK